MRTSKSRIHLPATDAVVLSVPTTRWSLEQLQAHAASGRYPTSLCACADEILRAALREIERPRIPAPKDKP